LVKIIILVLFAEAFTAVGQILFKKTANSIDTYSLRGIHAHKRFMSDVLTKPSIWAGLFYMGVGLVIWLFALAQAELSLVFPMTSLQYIMILFLAHIFLGEKIDKMKLAGTLLVGIGIIMITIS
jgi:drug/metabolite transporter (DMT)-like permease